MTQTNIVVSADTPEQMSEIAAAFAMLCEPGDVVLLDGELGAGKTHFVKGAAAALGVNQEVTSPTFAMVQFYKGDAIEVIHADVYRCDSDQEVIQLDIAELVEDGAVAFIEWGEKAICSVRPDYCHIEIVQPDVHVTNTATQEVDIVARTAGGAAQTVASNAQAARGVDAVESEEILDSIPSTPRTLVLTFVGRSWLTRQHIVASQLQKWVRVQ